MNKPPETNALCGRILALRLERCGPRGRAEFARMVGLNPSTYHYYEKGRIPPVPVLVRLSRCTGVSLQWLLTGDGPKYVAPTGDDQPAPVPPELARQIGELLARQPHLRRAIGAFVELLERTGDWPTGPTDTAPALPATELAASRQPGWIPVMGRTAAGSAHFWQDYNPRTDPQEFTRRIDQWVLGARPQSTRSGLAADAAAPGPSTDDVGPSVSLVQLSAPDQRGIIEFLDCAAIASRHARAVAWRIDGDSMSPRYEDGDLVICCPSQGAVDGQPAVVKLHDQIGMTCKIYRTTDKGLCLCSVNERYAPIEVPADRLRWGLRVLFRVRIGG